MSLKTVTVLLSTYNGEKFLEEQLQSLIQQKNVEVRILVRDDGSTDGTVSILDRWKNDRLLNWYTGDNVGAGKSFVDLLFKVPQSDYYAFCDQDDVWLPNKLELSLLKMEQCESIHLDKPIIIHTDMWGVNKDLELISDSFWKYSKLRPDILNTFKYLAICNSVNGCTMLLNNAARDIVIQKYFVQSLVLHDVLVSLIVAYNNGIIDYVETPTMLYRQHGSNVVGARERGTSFFVRKFFLLGNTIKNNVHRFQMVNTVGQMSMAAFIYYKVKYFFIR